MERKADGDFCEILRLNTEAVLAARAGRANAKARRSRFIEAEEQRAVRDALLTCWMTGVAAPVDSVRDE